MNILRWNRKNKKKYNLKTIILLIFSLIMTTFAWFAFSKVIEPTLNIHLSSWDMEYYIDNVEKTNPIAIEIPVLYPTMTQHKVIVDIFNNGETLVDIEHQVKSITIAGTTYELVEEGKTNTTPDYIALAPSILTTKVTEEEITDPDTGETTTNTITEEIYKNVIINDITRFPFTVEVEYSSQVEAVTEDEYGNTVPGEGYLKLTVTWIGDNNILDSEWGYIVGEYFANNPDATSAMSIVLSIDSYQVERNALPVVTTMPTTASTKPFLPDGFKRVPGTNLDNGLVIEDASGNQYVWVEVPRTATVYTTAGLGITQFTAEDTNGAYANIEADLRAYVGDYEPREDKHSSWNALGFGSDRYKELKQSMLKSVYTNGGFYIGRYETGLSSGFRSSASDTLVAPVIKANVYPYNYVTCSQASTKAISMAPTGYTTSLLFGLQWDLVMKYLETKGVSQDSLKTDSTLWGNYADNSYSLTNSNVKYVTNLLAMQWLTALPYEKDWNQKVLITSGGNSSTCKQNIYDLAGNLSEWTYNLTEVDEVYYGGNGGNYQTNGAETPARSYGSYSTMAGVKNVGFRVTLY